MPNIVRHCTAVLACLLALRATAGVAPWYFLPNFGEDIRGVERVAAGRFHETIPGVAERLLSPDGGLSPDQREQVRWHEAAFPHRGFVDMMPQQKAFGWYAHAFGVPQQFTGLDLLLDLGIIDDADETFVNGVRVGGLGKVPGGSAWQADRLYRIPASKINCFGDNLAAVHVWSLWGLGGIVGPPVLSAAIAPADAEWEIAFRPADAPQPEGLNDASDTADAVRICVGEWRVPARPTSRDGGTPPPHPAEWPENVRYAVFRLPVSFRGGDNGRSGERPSRFEKSVVLDIGPVFDVAAIYLNNKRIGRLGRFPENGHPAFTEAAARGRAVVQPEDWSGDGNDLLTVVVYCERGTGGLTGQPGLLLQNPLENVDIKDIASVTKAFDLFIQTDRFTEAEALLEKTVPQDDTARAWLLSHKAHLAFLQWLDGDCKDDKSLDGVLSPLAEILSKLPSEAPKQSAMQAFCRVLRMAEKDENLLEKVRHHFPKYAESLRFLGEDRETKGDWLFLYGNAQFLLCSMGQLDDWRDMRTRKSAVRVKVFAEDYGRRWLANSNRNVSSPEALIKLPFLIHDDYLAHLVAATPQTFFPVAKDAKVRRAAWWDDHGEMHPFDDEGPDLGVTTTPATDGLSRISWYLNDFDWRRTAHPRQQSMLVMDGAGELLSAAWIGKLDDGVYLRYEVDNPRELNYRFIKHRGACVAVNAMFVDEPIRFADTQLYREDREAFYKKYSEREAKKRLGKLPPETAALFTIVLEAERSFSFHPARERYIEELAKLESPEALAALLDQLARIDRLHLAWFSLAIARFRGIIAGVSPERQKAALQEVFTLCRGREWEVFRYAVSIWWRELGLPQDDPFYRREASRYQNRISK